MDKWHYASGAVYALRSAKKREYFYETGQLKTVEPLREGKLHGEVVLYWPNGKMKRKCSFQNGVRHGLDQMWNEEGVLVDEGRYG
jgi:antitoxin component YwqK of YwqJK toxin-antitoxin module